ncbi:hypothetical protein GCM10009555_012490 [Acrocarpospora macrocephala]|uniref:ATP-binding protein n=1 Tax=Acrocarpospora macrocephala TaxID=150177 RepID=A0A5M3XEG0_9ACTN|nr:hypothetical protein [Acrocarpospora macrocephala]GES16458.1 hypothetical protein Amac_100560 [Acrocarpospora macrocephala]
MVSFETLDSEYKLNQGCRGVGRLLWLKAFRNVEISSIFKEGNHLKERSFRFTAQDGVTSHEENIVERGETFAEINLAGFGASYQQSSRKKGSTIARDLLEHCLWYFVREGGAPNIVIFDGPDTIDLNVMFSDYMRSSSKSDRILIGNKEFYVVHIKLKANVKASPTLNWCAANRVVIAEGISGKIAGLHGSLIDTEGEFTYSGYLTSDFLDERVRPERTDFNLNEVASGVADDEQDNVQEALLEEEPSRSEIRDLVLKQVENYLADSLTVARDRGRDRVEEFVSSKAPRYRPVLRRIDEKGLNLDPSLSDKDLELELHKRLAELEAEVLREGQEVLENTILNLTDEDYAKKLDEYLAKVEDVKKSDLAAYVSRRKLILDLLAHVIQQQPNGSYCREDLIHNLIMPMRTTSNDSAHRASNLWIIDERLAFHNYLASDKPLRAMPITGSTSTKEPDLLALQTCNTPVLITEGDSPRWASLSVIEIKRPMRNDAATGEKDPIEQCLNYLQRVREGGVRTAKGRPIPGANKLPGFCYIIADLTKSILSRCTMHRLNPTDDGMGYFGYHEHFNAYIEVISFDRLLSVANQRNRAFFDVLDLPAS